MLDLRLAELSNVVNYFVLVEANKTHSGKDKRLLFNETKEKYKNYPIIHVIVDDMPQSQNAWEKENHQRRSIKKGIQELSLEDEDYFILTDADEIPDPDTIKNIASKGWIDCACLEMDLYYYNLSCKCQTTWTHPKIFNYGKFKEVGDFESMRFYSCNLIVPKGGWHLSYFGDSDFITNKIQSFAHQEYNTEKYKSKENIQRSIIEKTSLYDETKFLEINPNNNPYLPKNWKMLV